MARRHLPRGLWGPAALLVFLAEGFDVQGRVLLRSVEASRSASLRGAPSLRVPNQQALPAQGGCGSAVLLLSALAGLVLQGSSTRFKRRARAGRTATPKVGADLSGVVPRLVALKQQAESFAAGELKQIAASLNAGGERQVGADTGKVNDLLKDLVQNIDNIVSAAEGLKKRETEAPMRDQASRSAHETMMEVHVIGLSHHSAPVAVREKLAIPQPGWNSYAQELVQFSETKSGQLVPEVAVLSTCNRFELYLATPELKRTEAIACVYSFLMQQSGLSREELEPFLFVKSGEDATRHLFEVASGLDSLVLGEAQILGQVKACYEHCAEKEASGKVGGSGGKVVSKLLMAGIRVGKLVRTKTDIGKGTVSVSSAAVELMFAKAQELGRAEEEPLSICILGAGKMSRLLLINLLSRDEPYRITLVNRSKQKAMELFTAVREYTGKTHIDVVAESFDAMWDSMRDSDVVFAATAAQEPIITPELLRANPCGRTMLIDISVPLNIAAGCAQVQDISSYTVDDLKQVMDAASAARQVEAGKCRALIEKDIEDFKLWQASQGAVPYLAALQAQAEDIRLEETDKALRKKLNSLPEREREVVDTMTKAMIARLLKPLYLSMKDREDIDDKQSKIWALKKMFNLEAPGTSPLPPSESDKQVETSHAVRGSVFV